MIIVTVIFNLNIKKLILRDFWLEFGKLQGFSKEETWIFIFSLNLNIEKVILQKLFTGLFRKLQSFYCKITSKII